MPASVESLKHMPYWPLMLSVDQAAVYVGLSPTMFRTAVKNGLFPEPVRARMFGKRVLWYRPALDRAAADLAGERPSTDGKPTPIPQSEWDAWQP